MENTTKSIKNINGKVLSFIEYQEIENNKIEILNQEIYSVEHVQKMLQSIWESYPTVTEIIGTADTSLSYTYIEIGASFPKGNPENIGDFEGFYITREDGEVYGKGNKNEDKWEEFLTDKIVPLSASDKKDLFLWLGNNDIFTEEVNQHLTADDCTDIFLGILKGSSDLTKDLFIDLCSGYGMSLKEVLNSERKQ